MTDRIMAKGSYCRRGKPGRFRYMAVIITPGERGKLKDTILTSRGYTTPALAISAARLAISARDDVYDVDA